MEYPPEFSAAAQAAVEHEMLLANEEFEAAREFINSVYDHSKRELVLLVYNYIGRVLLAFAKEACALGRKRFWTVPQVRSKVDGFLKQIATEAEREKFFFRDAKHLEDVRLTNPYSNFDVPAAVMNQLRNLRQWKEYQKLLLEVARIQKRPMTSAYSGSSPLLRQLREEANITQQQLADLVKLDVKTIKRHEGSRTGIRGTNKRLYETELSKLLGRLVSL